MSLVNKPIPINVRSSDKRVGTSDLIRSSDSDAYILEITWDDVIAITGTVQLYFEIGSTPKTYATRDASDGVVLAGNKITYTLEPELYAYSGLKCWVQFINSNLFTPLLIEFGGIEVVPGGAAAATIQPYPSWVAAEKLVEAARVIAEGGRVTDNLNRAVWEAFIPADIYAVGNKAYYLGSSYIMHTASGVAGTLPTNTNYWSIIVLIGDAGTITVGSTNTSMTGLVAGNGSKIAAPTAAQVGALTMPDAGNLFPGLSTLTGQMQSAGSQLADNATNLKSKYGALGNDSAGDEIINDLAFLTAMTSVDNYFYLPSGIYRTAASFTVPANKTVIMHPKAVIKLVADVDGIVLSDNARVSGGSVDCTNVVGYSKAAMLLDGTEPIESLLCNDIQLINYNRTGTGIKLNCDGADNYVMLARLLNMKITRFGLGIHIYTASTGWANDNVFAGDIWGCVQNIRIEGDGTTSTGGNGNKFDMGGEVGPVSVPTPCIYCDGIGNIFNVYFSDVGKTGFNAEFIEFTKQSTYNTVNYIRNQSATPLRIIDNGSSNIIAGYPLPYSYLMYPAKGRTVVAPRYMGDQDDVLAYANKRYTLTSSVVGTVTVSNLEKAFKVLQETATDYPSITPTDVDNDEVTVNINTGSLTIYYPRVLGITFVSVYIPAYVKFRIKNSSNVWLEKVFDSYTTDSDYKSAVVWDLAEIYPITSLSSVKEIEVIIGKFAGSPTYIGRIFMSAGNGGYSYLPSGGGSLFGDLSMGDNYLKIGAKGLPTATEVHRGRVIRVEGGVGVADSFLICMKNTAEGYNWKVITLT